MSFGKYIVGWESADDGELIGSYHADSEKEAISSAKEDMRFSKMSIPSNVTWHAYKEGAK